jgi:hypothetical protein
MTKQINIIVNGKGGVGKSFFATNFVQYLKDHQIEHCAFDTDNENSTLKRFHEEAEFINLGKPQQIDKLFSSLKTSDLVVVDCRAASTNIFLRYFTEVRVFEILEMLGASLTVICPINHEADSVEQVKLIAKELGDKCRYVIVRNQAHSEQFKIYDESHTRPRILGEFGGREIVMPKLYDWLVTGLNENNLSIAAALGPSDFSLVDRQRLKNWQATFYEQIELARELLLPGMEQPKSGGKSKKKTAPPTDQPEGATP